MSVAHVSRRCFGASALSAVALSALSMSETALAIPPATKQLTGKIYTALKWGMIADGKTVREKLQLCKELGYGGVELVSPANFSASEVRRASEQTDMPVHGVVNMKHWSTRLSSPSAKVRDEAVEILQQAIRDADTWGGDSVLLVPGKVTGAEENHDHVWRRSILGIRQVLPLASRLGVRVLIENVWNGFCETPDQLRDYIDEISSPWVGVYFDIGNAQKFQPSQEWIRILGNRIVKLDVKGWGQQAGFCKIGDGDIRWAEVRQALAEIRFTGWATAEVSGGGRKRLTEIAKRMDQALYPSRFKTEH